MNPKMNEIQDWSSLTQLTRGQDFLIEQVRLAASGIAISGRFAPPPLAALAMEDQIFVAAFVKSHGSLKEMERLFGISYPTVKARLNRIGSALGFVAPVNVPSPTDVLESLERGEIDAEEAAVRLGKRQE